LILISHRRPPARALSALLALLVCFFAVALYSPLHVHKNQQCSLNNLEHQIADSITPVVDLPQPLDETVAALAETALTPPAAPAFEHASRGPPAISFS
jgi:hypothetical protein